MDMTDELPSSGPRDAGHTDSFTEPTCAYCGRRLGDFARVDFLAPPERRFQQRNRPRDRGTWRSRVRPERR